MSLKELNAKPPLEKAELIIKELQMSSIIEKISSGTFDNLSEVEQGKAFRAMSETGRLWPKGAGGVRRAGGGGEKKRGKKS